MNSETITRDDISVVAKEVAIFLKSHGIRRLNDLEKKAGTVLEVKGRLGHSIRIDSRPSGTNGKECTLYYRVLGRGTPFEVRFNPRANSTRAFAKGDFALQGYSPFDTDEVGNRTQEMYSEGCSIGILRASLKPLY